MKTVLSILFLLTACAALAESDSNTVCSATNAVSVRNAESNIVTGTTAGKPDAYTGATRKKTKQK